MVSVLAGVEDFGDGTEGGVGQDGPDGDLVAGLVPQDGDVEGGEQPCFERGRHAGHDVAGVGDLVQEGGVHRRGGDGLQGG